MDAQGAVTVAGFTDAANIPTTPGAFDTSPSDAFVIRLAMLPSGVAAFGDSSFALTCGNAAPNTVGLIAFAATGLPAPLSVLGVEVWIDPTVLLVTATVFSNPIGASEVPLPSPTNPTLASSRPGNP